MEKSLMFIEELLHINPLKNDVHVNYKQKLTSFHT
jgi:hypothetical protein